MKNNAAFNSNVAGSDQNQNLDMFHTAPTYTSSEEIPRNSCENRGNKILHDPSQSHYSPFNCANNFVNQFNNNVDVVTTVNDGHAKASPTNTTNCNTPPSMCVGVGNSITKSTIVTPQHNSTTVQLLPEKPNKEAKYIDAGKKNKTCNVFMGTISTTEHEVVKNGDRDNRHPDANESETKIKNDKEENREFAASNSSCSPSQYQEKIFVKKVIHTNFFNDKKAL